ncbi:MAG: hypothetical protein IJN69_01955 [Oscillospiraceae bacterium]|nr:hypothetical protein [Oscillospiraceae bacterium]
MVNFKDIFFGCSDANTEAERYPKDFKLSFFDPNNYMEELINGYKFLLIGRKGEGKTAYNAQITLTASENNIYAYQRTLNNFNNTTFSKLKTYSELGSNTYISLWKSILLIEAVRMLFEFEPNIPSNEFVNIMDALNSNGFLQKDDDIAVTVTKLVESDSSLNVKSTFSHNRRYETSTELRGSEAIYNAILNSIKNLYFHSKFIFIIDGLDDILNNSEFKSEIIMGLIRAAEEINKTFRKFTLNLKVVILIRSDILKLCHDPNLTKIIRDSGIRLSWQIYDNPFDSNLLKLVEKRVGISTENVTSLKSVLDEILPDVIHNKNTMDYLLDNIIYRPRDILQLFSIIQEEYIPNKKLTEDKLETVLKRYSTEYFLSAMQDELTGFFPNDAVTKLPTVLTKMGTQYFYVANLETEIRKYPEFNGISAQDILETLFNAGYIGQHRPREKTDFTVFSYRNNSEVLNVDHQCILHRGLMRALSI